jgi:hypothetical protein
MRLHPCPLAKAGGSKCKAEGYPHPWNEVERAERSGGLHKRSAEDWGDGLRAREGGAILGDWKIECCSEDFCCLLTGFQRLQIRSVRRDLFRRAQGLSSRACSPQLNHACFKFRVTQ